MSDQISAKDVRVGDEIEFKTADGKIHRFIVGELPKAEIYIIPEDAAHKLENMFTLGPKDQVTRHHNVLDERREHASAVGRLTAERMRDG